MEIIIAQIPIETKAIKFGDENFLFGLTPSVKFGQLNQKFSDFHDRHIYMNRILDEIYRMYFTDRMRFAHNFNASLDLHQKTIVFHTQTILHWIRKNIDELIGLHYYYEHILSGNGEPDELHISSIGSLLHDRNKDHVLRGLFKVHLERLNIINEVSNTYKHSFINSEVHGLYGADAPTVNSLDPKGSSKSSAPSEPVYRAYFLHDMVSWYSDFFLTARDVAKKIQKELWERMKNTST